MMLGGLTVALALTLGSQPGAAAEATAAGAEAIGGGFQQARGYLHVAPGMLAATLAPRSTAFYSWGLSAGYHLPISKFAMQVGAFFDHVVGVSGYEASHFLSFGPELRLGGASRTTFGYFLLRLGPTVVPFTRSQGPAADGGPFEGVRMAGMLTLGGGVQALVHRNVALGWEPAFDLMAGQGVTGGFFRMRAFVALLF